MTSIETSTSDASDEENDQVRSKIAKKKKTKRIVKNFKIEKDSSDEEDTKEKTYEKNQPDTKKIKIEKNSGLIIDQPITKTPKTQVKFDNETSTLHFPPSFNLQTNQQSTPKHPPSSTVITVPQIHSIDQTYDIEQKADRSPSQTYTCLVS